MKSKITNRIYLLPALLLSICLPLQALAGDAVSTMASVMSELNHFPSASDKESLGAIVDDASSTSAEKQLAGIISRIAHQASAADKASLEEVVAQDDVSAAIKTIAKAIINTNHRPQDADRTALKALIH